MKAKKDDATIKIVETTCSNPSIGMALTKFSKTKVPKKPNKRKPPESTSVDRVPKLNKTDSTAVPNISTQNKFDPLGDGTFSDSEDEMDTYTAPAPKTLPIVADIKQANN